MRQASIERMTAETWIRLTLDLDSMEPATITTNVPLLTHFLSAFAVHGEFFLNIEAVGDVEVDAHHLVEDVGIVLGQALQTILRERRGIARFGQRLLPMDEALVVCAVDLSGRGQSYWSGGFPDRAVGVVGSEVWPEFFNGFARASQSTVHLRYVAGENAHHVYEACFKGFGVALREAVTVRHQSLPSTKGVL